MTTNNNTARPGNVYNSASMSAPSLGDALVQVRDSTGTTHVGSIDAPGGKKANVTIRIGAEGMSPEGAREGAALTAQALTMGRTEQREIDLAEAKLAAVEYDPKTGETRPVVSGRQRENLELRLRNLYGSLGLASIDAKAAHNMQTSRQANLDAAEQRVIADAETRAAEMVHNARVEDRARAIARKAGFDLGGAK